MTANLQAVACSTSGYHNGGVWGAGDNSTGQLAIPFSSVNKELTNLPIPQMVQVHAGIFQSYFIDENGSVWVCGENSFGSLGTRNPADVKKFSEPKKMPDLPPIQGIFTGNTYAFLLDY